MKTKTPLYLTITTALLIGCYVQPGAAQVPNERLAMKIITASKANAALLKQYSWSSRTELLDSGSVKDIRIDLVTYDLNGQLQRSVVNDQSAPLPDGFLRKRIAETEREKVEKYMAGLGKLFDQYTQSSAGKVIDFISQAQISAPDSNGLLQITGGGVLSPGDTLTMWIDGATRQLRKIQITTTYEQDPVQLTATYVTLKSGPTHVQYAEATVAAKGITFQVHNFDYNSNN